jgi:hypothetical protein
MQNAHFCIASASAPLKRHSVSPSTRCGHRYSGMGFPAAGFRSSKTLLHSFKHSKKQATWPLPLANNTGCRAWFVLVGTADTDSGFYGSEIRVSFQHRFQNCIPGLWLWLLLLLDGRSTSPQLITRPVLVIQGRHQWQWRLARVVSYVEIDPAVRNHQQRKARLS